MNWFKRIKVAGWLDSATNNLARQIFDKLKQIKSTEDTIFNIRDPLDGVNAVYVHINHRELVRSSQ